MVIKVMVADDQALIRESLKIILSAHPDIEVVATVEDGNHVVSSIPQTHPDLILMDIRMPGMDGVLATKEVKEHYPDIKIIILENGMQVPEQPENTVARDIPIQITEIHIRAKNIKNI